VPSEADVMSVKRYIALKRRARFLLDIYGDEVICDEGVAALRAAGELGDAELLATLLRAQRAFQLPPS
jgi:hypothetical protein